MNWLRDASIRAKLAGGLGLALALVVAGGLFGLFQLQSLNQSAAEVTRIWLPRVELLGEIKAEMAEHRLLARRRTETNNFHQLAEIAERMDAVASSLRLQWQAYEQAVDTVEEKVLFAQLRARWLEYETALDKAIARLDAGEMAPALEDFEDDTLRVLDQALARIDELIVFSKRQSTDAADRAERIFRTAVVLTGAAIVFSVLFLGGAILWISRYVSGPIQRVSEAMRRLTIGDASATIADDVLRKDEVGSLIAAVEGYRKSLIRGRELAGEAEQERQRLSAAVDNMPIGLVMFDAGQRLIIANACYAQLYRLPPELARPGTPLKKILDHRVRAGNYPGTDSQKYVDYLARIVEHGATFRDFVQFHDGRIISLVYQPMEGGGWISTHEDITDRRKAEAKIAHMTHHDALTDLPNRALLRERIEDALVRAARDSKVAILCLDLDHFKDVNDTLGHPFGDELLLAAAKRLAGCAREGDTVARLGGDEFAIVQIGAEQPQGARTLAERVIQEISAPYVIDGHQAIVGASIGIALAPADGRDADHLMKSGDMALYRAKADGRGVYRFFEPDMDARMQARHALELDLRRAIETGQFSLAYQPQFNLATNVITGFEALLRWRHPERGDVTPLEFIPLAEETGLIVPIGDWVLRHACMDAMQWPSAVRVAVNLSPVQFRSARLMQGVIAALAASGLPARRLELEITESVLLADSEATLASLHQLRAIGVRISMDDFGTGYSSLSYLQSFPFDKIKIDRRFVTDINREASSLAIIRAVTGLSASLGITTTAEGVETREQFDRVKAEGCTEVQGFLTGRPMTLADAVALFSRPGSKASAA